MLFNIKNWQDKHLITELDFKNQKAFQKYDAENKIRKSTKITVGGKSTTAGEQGGGTDVEGSKGDASGGKDVEGSKGEASGGKGAQGSNAFYNSDKKERRKLFKKHNTWKKDAEKNINRERYWLSHMPDRKNPEELKNTKITTPPEFRASVESQLRYPGVRDDDQWVHSVRDAIDKADTETINSAIDFLDAYHTDLHKRRVAEYMPGGKKYEANPEAYKDGTRGYDGGVLQDPDQYSRTLAGILSGRTNTGDGMFRHVGIWTPPNDTGTTSEDYWNNYDKDGNKLKKESVNPRSTRIQEVKMYQTIQELKALEKGL